MIDSISSNNPIARNPIAAPDQTAPKPPTTLEDIPVKTDASKGDVVQLSDSAQAKLLKQHGLDIAQIAIKLGLDEKTVSTFFPTVTTKE
jgi:hypothetical protein